MPRCGIWACRRASSSPPSSGDGTSLFPEAMWCYLVLGAGVYEDDVRIQLKEIVLQTHHPWVGHPLRDLDISRQTVIIMVRRRNRTLIPNGGLKLLAGDKVFLYTQSHLPHAQDIQI